MEETRNNTKILLIQNKVYPHRMPSPVTRDSFSGLSWRQEDNAGALQ